MRILISHPDTLGDLVLRQPMLEAIASAGHELMMVVRPSVEGLARQLVPGATILTHPAEVYALTPDGPWEPFGPVFARAKKVAPDMLVVAPFRWTLFEEKLAHELPDVPRVGMSGNLYHGDPFAGAAPVSTLTFDRVAPVAETDREVDKNAALAAAVLGHPVVGGDPVLSPPTEAIEDAKRLLAEVGFAPGGYWVACVAGTAHVAIKTWPPERWGAALSHWAGAYGRKFLFVGLPAEQPVVDDVRAAMDVSARDGTASLVRADVSLATLQALVALSNGYVGHDTGPMHVAAAVGKPVLGVFGGGTWGRFLPAVAPSVAVTVGVPCVGCGWVCPFETSYCIKSVPLDIVTRAIDDLEAGRVTDRQTRVVEPDPALMARLTRESARAAEARLREAVEARKQLALAQAQVAPAIPVGQPVAPPPPPPEPEVPAGPTQEELVATATAPLRQQVERLEAGVRRLERDLESRIAALPAPPKPRRPLRQLAIDLIIGRQHVWPKPTRPFIPVSVVVPVVGDAPLVKRTINSLVAQDYPNLEVVAVTPPVGADDAELSAWLASRDRRVRTVAGRKETPSMPPNLIAQGMTESYGQVLSFARPGVTFEPGAIGRAADLFVRRRFVKVAYFEAARAAATGGAWKTSLGPTRRVDTIDLLSSGAEPLVYDAMFWRRSAYLTVGGINAEANGPAYDWDLAARSARMFGLARGEGTAVVLHGDGEPSTDPNERHQALDESKSRFMRNFGRPGRWRCAVIHKINRLRDGLHGHVARLASVAPVTVPTTRETTPTTDPAAAPRCPLTRRPAGRLLFTDVGPSGAVARVFYCPESRTAVVAPTGQTVADGPVPSPHAGRPLDHARTLRKDPPGGSRQFPSTPSSPVAQTYRLAVESLRSAAPAGRTVLNLSGDATAMMTEPAVETFDGPAVDAALSIPDDRTFDVVVLGFSLQRTDDPLTLLRRARNLLSPGGLILVTTSNLDSAVAGVYGPTWAGWDVDRSRTILSPAGLDRLATEAGLVVELMESKTYPDLAATSATRHRTGTTAGEPTPGDLASGARLTAWAGLLWDWRRKGDVLHAALRERD
jgi:ADP-heptose:LPS heptosyltransferase